MNRISLPPCLRKADRSGSVASIIGDSLGAHPVDVLAPVEGPPVPGRIVERPQADRIDALRLVGLARVGPVGAPARMAIGRLGHRALAARQERRVDRLAGADVGRAGIHRLHRLDLRGREALASLSPGLQASVRDVELALPRVVDDAVLHAVQRVARLDRGLVHQPQRVGRQDGRRVVALGVVLHEVPEEGEVEVGAVVAGIAGDDAVVVGGVALRRRQRLMAAGRAAGEIGIAWARAEQRRRDLLGRHRALVHRTAAAPIDDRLGMADAELQVAALVAGVGRDHDVAGAHALRHLGVVDAVVVGAVADRLQPPAPAAERQPDLEADLRAGHRRGRAQHAAERRQVGVIARLAAGTLRLMECARPLDRRLRDARMRQGEPGERLTLRISWDDGCGRLGKSRVRRRDKRPARARYGASYSPGEARRLHRSPGQRGAAAVDVYPVAFW